MKTVSGALVLNKKEVEALNIIIDHVKTDISYREGGTFNHLVDGDFPFDEKEAKKAELGLEVIDFILQVTK